MEWRAWLNNKTDRIELKNVLIAFDTSTLLNLYSFPVGTTNSYLAILAKLRSEEQKAQNVTITIPPQVVFEFVTSFSRAKKDALESYDTVISKLQSIKGFLDGVPEYLTGPMKSDWNVESSKFLDPFLTRLEGQRKDIKKRNENDPVFKFLGPLFDETKRCAPTSEEREWLDSNGAERYRMLIPPGFEDRSKTSGVDNPQSYYVYGAENKVLKMYGDLLVWRQLLDYAKALERPTRSLRIIFVTDDEKPDWFRGQADLRRQHPLLTVEAMETGFRLNVINSDQFLRLTGDALKINVGSADFEAVRRVLREHQPALNFQKEVQTHSECVEAGLVSLVLKRPVPVATATLPFESKFPQKPRLTVDFEVGPTRSVRCFGGVGAFGDFNVHINSAVKGEPLPEGEYIVRYRAETVNEGREVDDVVS